MTALSHKAKLRRPFRHTLRSLIPGRDMVPALAVGLTLSACLSQLF